MGIGDVGSGVDFCVGLIVIIAAAITAFVGLIKASPSYACASLFLVMIPVSGCGFGLWHRVDEFRPWFQFVWLIQAALIITILVSARFRVVGVVALLLTVFLAYWLVSWPVRSWDHNDEALWTHRGQWVQDLGIRRMAWLWAGGLLLSVVSAIRALRTGAAKKQDKDIP